MAKKTTPAALGIPTSFQLAGCTWNVKIVQDLPDMGLCDPAKYEIYIREGMNSQATLATFFHELVHAIKFVMGETDHNEKEVEGFGNLLHQWLITLKL